MSFLLFVCLCLLAVAGICVVMLRSQLKAAISLAVASAFLSIILFIMGAPWAALVELSVCAGLITVVFVSAISLTTKDRRDTEHSKDHRKHFAALPFLLIFVGLGLIAVLILTEFNVDLSLALPASFAEFKDVLWQTRQTDIFGQIIIIFAGAFAVVVLFKERDDM